MSICEYCGLNPPIENSHIASAFLIRHIKNNGSFSFLLNSWDKGRTKKWQDGIKVPLLCAKCDNETFSQWETPFGSRIFNCRFENKAFDNDIAIRFFLSIIFRYASYFAISNPGSPNIQNNIRFRDLTKQCLFDISKVGKHLFMYPYLYKRIEDPNRKMISGVNQVLRMMCHGVSLPKEDLLPNAFLIIIPDYLVLVTDSPLENSKDCNMKQPKQITSNNDFSYKTDNTDMPDFISSVLNGIVNETKSHQKTLGLWWKIQVSFSKLLYPERIIWQVIEADKMLANNR